MCGTAQAADTWLSGQSHFYSRRGLTGGGTALDALSGVSMCPNDYAITLDISGNTIYFHQVSASGNVSGTTGESSPFWIAPNTAASGNSLAGVSMWKLTGLSGDTGFFRTLVIDTRTVTGSTIDLWNAVTNGATTYYFAGVSGPVQFTLNQLQAMLGVSPAYLTGNTAPSLPTVKTEITNGTSTFITGNTAPSLPEVKTEITNGTSPFLTGNTAPSLPEVKTEITSGGSIYALQSLVNAYLGTGAVSGNSLAQVYALQSMLTTALNAASFSGDTAFALQTFAAAIMAQLTQATNSASFSGNTGFALQTVVNAVIAQLTQATASGAVSGDSIFAMPATATQFNAALTQAAIKATGFALNSELTDHTTTLTGVSGEMLSDGSNAVGPPWPSPPTTFVAQGAAGVSGQMAVYGEAGSTVYPTSFLKISGGTVYAINPVTGVTLMQWGEGDELILSGLPTIPGYVNESGVTPRMASVANAATSLWSLPLAVTDPSNAVTVFVPTAYSVTMTGVSLFVPQSEAAFGVSVYWATGTIPEPTGVNKLFDHWGSGGSVYNMSGTTQIPAGKILKFEFHTPPAGVSVYTLTVFGRRDP
jgi:hypothetical protein